MWPNNCATNSIWIYASMLIFYVGFWSDPWIASGAFTENRVYCRRYFKSKCWRFQFGFAHFERNGEYCFPFGGNRSFWSRHQGSGQFEYVGQQTPVGSVFGNEKFTEHHTCVNGLYESSSILCRWTSLPAKSSNGFGYIHQMCRCFTRRFSPYNCDSFAGMLFVQLNAALRWVELNWCEFEIVFRDNIRIRTPSQNQWLSKWRRNIITSCPSPFYDHR